MISNYYVLVGLANELRPMLTGTRIVDAYSQAADELSIIFERSDHAAAGENGVFTLRMSTAAPLRYILLNKGSGRAKRNTADVLGSVVGAEIADVRVVPGDRIVDILLRDKRRIRLVLFGANSNAYLLGGETVAADTIVDAFQSASKFVGSDSSVRSIQETLDFDGYVSKWNQERSGTLTCGQVLSRIEPLFNRFMADEVVVRAGLPVRSRASDADESVIRLLFEGVQSLRSLLPRPDSLRQDPGREAIDAEPLSAGQTDIELSTRSEAPAAWIYWTGRKPERMTLFESEQMVDYESESFNSVLEAVSVFVRRTLSIRSLLEEHAPILKKVATARKRAQRRLEELERELERAPRSDEYERTGHILMAQPQDASPVSNPFLANDIFSGGEVSIKVDQTLSLIENANRYYEKAKAARLARESATTRLDGARKEADRMAELHEALSGIDTLDEWKKFSRDRKGDLEPFTDSASGAAPTVPFRQFDLGQGYVVWVGRNAKQNELLSSKAARKFDLWFHARGVAGSHVVLRLPQRNAQADPRIVEMAARIAAYYSKARGGSMVPVIVAEAKHVRKPRGAAPGSVLVEKERVLLVDPGLPEK
ncbi:MAG: DUF814 domain-containing protein [Rhodothermales bacterium]|nr:DUF814 domain-containing protein [Rhodothermales bacterium]